MSVRLAALLACCAFALCSPVAEAQARVTVNQTAPVYVLPDTTRQPLAQLDPSMSLVVVQTQGSWLVVSWEDQRIGRRTGYLEARFVNRAAATAAQTTATQVPPAQNSSNTSAPAAPVDSRTPTSAATPASSPVSLRTASVTSVRDVHRLYIEKMDNDLDQYLSAEISKQLSGRLIVVLQKDGADAILRGVSSEKTGVGAAVTGRYLGLHDNASGTITLIDPAETVVLWASEAGDRSLMWGSLARGGQRKVASRLVSDLKKALTNAK